MVHLKKSDFTTKTVRSKRMLQKGGTVGAGEYVRRTKNLISSKGLMDWWDEVREKMRENCSIKTNKLCAPEGKEDELAGKRVPGKPGKMYTRCSPEEREKRLLDAMQCAKRTLTKRGEYQYSPAGKGVYMA